MTAQPFHGVLVPVLTPFTPAGEPDAGRFTAFCRFLLDQGAGGLSIFGTTSEANSMSPAERMALLDHLVAAGIPAEKLMPGAGACAMTDAATLVRHAVGHGCGGVLMLPPFYYKPVSDDGIFAFVSGVIDKVGSLGAPGLSLSHPAGGGGRLLARPGRPLDQGLSADRRRLEGQLRRLEQHRGACSTVIRGLRYSPAPRCFCSKGCARAVPAASPRPAISTCRGSPSSTPIGRGRRPTPCRPRSTTVRKTMQAYPMVPALKRVVAHFHDDPEWAAVRPPLTALDRAQSAALIADLGKIGFSLGERRQRAAAE